MKDAKERIIKITDIITIVVAIIISVIAFINTRFPKLQFVVIDDREVVFVSSAYKPNLCSIKNTRIASIFCNYFEQAWELSKKIKDRNQVDDDLIKEISERYK